MKIVAVNHAQAEQTQHSECDSRDLTQRCPVSRSVVASSSAAFKEAGGQRTAVAADRRNFE